MKSDNFAVFILTHGRPDNVLTLKTLLNQGYTGKWYLIIDDEDKMADSYFSRFGKERVVQFCKEAAAASIDEGDISRDRRAIIYARNECFRIARDLGVKYFLQLDDDYTSFSAKFTKDLKFCRERMFASLDNVFSHFVDFMENAPSVYSIAMAQTGDFIGGAGNQNAENITTGKGVKFRKCMNTFFCSTERHFSFVGRINEDVNTYTSAGSRGMVFLTMFVSVIKQKTTQKNKGGMTDLYLDGGTYMKSFYSVMYHPSSVKIGIMGDTHKRIHHHVKWENTVPKILRESVKK